MKPFLWALVLLSLLCLILYEILVHQETKRITTTAIDHLDVWKIIQTERYNLQRNSNISYMSKIRVSTGLNAIPNRKAARAATKTVTARAIKRLDAWKIIEAERKYLHGNPNLNYVNKRRVPTGPNAIHNRKVGEYREPPNRV